MHKLSRGAGVYRIFWLLYFFSSVLLYFFILYFYVGVSFEYGKQVLGFYDYLGAGLSFVALIGLHGFIFSGKTSGMFFWRIFFFVIVSWDVSVFLFGHGGLGVYAFLFFIPLYYALFLYAGFLENNRGRINWVNT